MTTHTHEGGIPEAIGYLRSDISAAAREYDEYRLRRLATRYGYRLLKIVAFGPRVDDPQQRLITIVESLRPEAVFVIAATHFDGSEVPPALIRLADVITVDDEHTYARWGGGRIEPPEDYGVAAGANARSRSG